MNDVRPSLDAPPQKGDTGMADEQPTSIETPPLPDGDLGRVGAFRLVRALGQGGMGVVYQAEDTGLGRAVAIKVIRPELACKPGIKERFLREARACAALQSDHIVPIFQVADDASGLYIVMPLLQGESLDAWLRRRGDEPVPTETTLKVAEEVALGLAAAHEKGIVHRDVKPANIWLDTADDRARLLDFGLAREIADEEGLTEPGALLGTPAYLAPEQARAEPVDARADLFSLGVVLYRLCAGRLPFRATDPMSALIALAMEDPPPPASINPAVPTTLSELVMRLLEKDRDRRPESARAVAETLRGMREQRTVPVPSAPRRRRWPVIACAAAGLSGLLVAAVLWLQTPHGAVRIEVNDPDIEVTVDKAGMAVKGAGKEPIRLAAGAHGLTVKRGDLEFETSKFLVRKGETVTLKVELLNGKVKVAAGDTVLGEREIAKPRFPPLKPGWLERVGDLPAKARAEAVEEELRKRHPGVDPIFTQPAEINAGKVVQVTLGKVRDLTPLAALPQLEKLRIDDPSTLEHLSPLRPLKLAHLEIGPDHLDVAVSKVADLSPLSGMPLRHLTFRSERAVDYSPILSLPLETVRLWRVPGGTNLASLASIKTLRELYVIYSALNDLGPFRERRLKNLVMTNCPLSDLSPASNMPLEHLDVSDTKLTGLSALKGMQLAHLNVTRVPLSREDLAVIRSLPLAELYVMDTGLRSLDFLRGTKLTHLDTRNNQVNDLAALRGMPLTSLWIDETAVSDLSPLAGTPLTEISFTDAPVKSITVLADMPLTQIWCTFDRRRDEKVLRAIKSLERINDTPIAEFWKKLEE